MIDVNRLHSVIPGKLKGRGCGKTFASVVELASCITLGHELILCRIKRQRDLNYIFDIIMQVFHEFEIKIDSFERKSILNIGNTRVVLIPEDVWDERTRGYREYVMVDFVDY